MLEELLACLGAVDDPLPGGKVEHRLIDVLAISVCAVLAGAESFEDIALYGQAKRAWLSQFLALPGGIPSHDTVRRVLMLIAPEQFEDAFLAWTRQALCTGDGDGEPMQIVIDGKTVRRSFDRRRERTPLHLVSAFGQRLRHPKRPGPGAASGAGREGRQDGRGRRDGGAAGPARRARSARPRSSAWTRAPVIRAQPKP